MVAKDKKRLVILDTHAILHRAYHALPEFSSSKGEPTGALYGLISMLVKIIVDLKPDYIVAAFDLPGTTYRHAAYEKYKATRLKADDDLVAQIIRSRDVLDAFGIPRYEKDGYEADDCIGTIVEKMKKEKDLDMIIASGDTDTLQLVDNKRVRVFMPKKGLSETKLYDEAAVKMRYGFGPELIPDYKGLRGDSSDNIPGVKGIGEKTATTLIQNFGTLEQIYKTLKKSPEKLLAAGVKEGMIEKLKEQEEQAELSKVLGEIHKKVPIDFKLPKKEWREEIDATKTLDMLSAFEFRSLIPRVRQLLQPKLLEKNLGGGAPSGVEPDGDKDFFQDVSGEKRGKSLHHQQELAMPPSGISKEEFDKVALAVWVLDSSITEPMLEDIYRVGHSQNFEEAKKHILGEIKKNKLDFVYEKIELPLWPVLRRMEERGVLVDREFLKTLAKKYHHELEKLAKKIYKAAGEEFNINSPKQLGDVLFDKLGLSVKNQKKTAGGQRSTKESELERMKDLHPIVADILAYRELQKLLSTYIDTLPTLLDKNNRVHTTYIQTGSATGRLASKDPNLQNIPIKTDLGRAIRDAFFADRSYALVSFDYSQIELRIAALLSGEEGLIEIFKRGGDAHAEVAARVFHVEPNNVTYEQRRRAKVINFGILYGMGVNALRAALGTTRAEAQEFYNQYFEVFPTLAKFIEHTKEDATRRGYTETLFGRRRYFEGIKSPIPYVRAAAERMAINAPMQGTQADIVKLAMIKINELFEKEDVKDNACMLLQVHDELVFEIKKDLVEKLAPKIKDIMENVVPAAERKHIPFIVEGKVGKNWGEMQKIS